MIFARRPDPLPLRPAMLADVAEPARVRLLRRALVALLVVWAPVYLVALARQPAAGTDFAAFYAASRAVAAGDNPYDWPTQWRWEDQALNHGASRLPLPYSFAPYGNPPPFAQLLVPLSALLPPRPAYAVWVALSLAATLAAGYTLTRWAGYRRPLGLAVLLAAAPCATFGYFLGQSSWLALLGLATALGLAATQPVAAGALLVLLAYVKPHLGLPLALIALLACASPRRFTLGLALGATLWLTATLLLAGSSALGAWLHALTLFRSSIAAQPDIASLPGLYTFWAPPALTTALDALLLLGGSLLLLARRPRATQGAAGRRRFLGLGVAAVLAVLPYAHTHDDVLLAVPLLLLVRPDWSGLRRPSVVLAVVATLLTPLLI